MSRLFPQPSRRQLLADNQALRAHLFDLGALSEVQQQSVMVLHENAAQESVETESLLDLTALDGPVTVSHAELVEAALERGLAARSSLADQPVLLPTTVLQARIEIRLVQADRARVERINDRLRAQLAEKDAVVLALMGELTQARLAILTPHELPDMVVPWQTLSSAV